MRAGDRIDTLIGLADDLGLLFNNFYHERLWEAHPDPWDINRLEKTSMLSLALFRSHVKDIGFYVCIPSILEAALIGRKEFLASMDLVPQLKSCLAVISTLIYLLSLYLNVLCNCVSIISSQRAASSEEDIPKTSVFSALALGFFPTSLQPVHRILNSRFLRPASNSDRKILVSPGIPIRIGFYLVG